MKTKIILLILIIFSLNLNGQNIEFSFANAQTTNDGSNDFFEVDVMIATVNGQPDFKLGKGQVYINYNSSAFGNNIAASGGLEITYPEVDGYILGLTSGFPYYSTPVQNDNSVSRFSFSYQQGISSGSMPTDNVTSTPTKLFHIRMQFTNSGEMPMVVFEDNETQPPGVAGCRDQFETACGPSTAGFPDCVGFAGVVFEDANFDSGGSTLSTKITKSLRLLSIYPNPTEDLLYVDVNVKSNYRFIDMFGKIVKTGKFDEGKNEIQLRNYKAGVYFLRVLNESNIITKKIVLQ